MRLTQIASGIFSSPSPTSPQRLSCTYPTTQSNITRLIAAGILSEVPNVRPKTCFAPAVYEIAYERLRGSIRRFSIFRPFLLRPALIFDILIYTNLRHGLRIWVRALKSGANGLLTLE